MKSILQEDTAKCFICEENPCGDPLDKHHIFGGALRKKSEQYGLFVYLHHARCHIFARAAHTNQEKSGISWSNWQRKKPWKSMAGQMKNLIRYFGG